MDTVTGESRRRLPATTSGWTWNPKRIVQLGAVVLAVVPAFIMASIPVGSLTSVNNSDGGAATTAGREWSVVAWLVLAIPVLLALLPFFVRGSSWPVVSLVATVMLGLFAVIGSLSLGFYFLPAFAAALVAVILPPRRRATVPA